MHFDTGADFTLIGAVKQILIDNVCTFPAPVGKHTLISKPYVVFGFLLTMHTVVATYTPFACKPDSKDG